MLSWIEHEISFITLVPDLISLFFFMFFASKDNLYSFYLISLQLVLNAV